MLTNSEKLVTYDQPASRGVLTARIFFASLGIKIIKPYVSVPASWVTVCETLWPEMTVDRYVEIMCL